MTMEVNLKGHYAGFISRLLAYSVDLVIVVISLTATGWVIKTTLEIFGLDIINLSFFWIAVSGVVSFLFVAGYYIFFWSLIAQTPGKMIMGLRIVAVDGSPVTVWQSVRRFVGYIVSLILFLGYIWILVDDRRQGWHDKIASTFVVYTWDARPGRLFRERVAGEPEA